MERSQRIEDSLKGKERTWREGLLRRAVVSGQESCEEDNTEKSTDEVEDRGCKAETG